ncbi:uncharacterized protein RCC_05672 [Ramularia collo-cygni]|uniref:Atos-like conserved domain-containing protein n=1 Tax=Ramularia collo-cygni TaxID=112498 RepID=A0A2D3V883_9PEZI|nr:uncharacterized protein RCC_05672 [Ramularia collo-cygni]CZT19816.1 uncharacterized protein RCC_05672 [Ramularia collo-cygni]
MAGNGCPRCCSEYGQHSEAGHGMQETVKVQDEGRSSPAIFNPFYTGRPRTPAGGSKSTSIDRQEIIRKIKSGTSRSNSPETERKSSTRTSTLNARSRSPEVQHDNQSIGMQIERPRSALHSGDFRDRNQTSSRFQEDLTGRRDRELPAFSTSPVALWHTEFPVALQHIREEGTRSHVHARPINQQIRSRAASNASLATSFVYKPPTSPLVHSSRPDTPEPCELSYSRSPDKSRRHTFSPQSFQRFQPSLDYPSSSRQQPPSLRAEKTFPYQAHQPMRSLNSTSYTSQLQSSLTGSRRPSFSETPLHHAPMVGSYEESILRGRMSTIPSKPLNFVAQIGVLGKGNCKSSLRCPRHVSVPFPAVFYSYGAGIRSTPGGDQPSPYVGLIDLENSLPSAEETLEKRFQRLHGRSSNEGSRASSRTREDALTSDAQAKRRRRQKDKRRSGSPKAPPGGSYRIPQQGQLQIVIKNPNKTAVKLFLIPYDLTDMEPGQKTFIRQRSYSAGPIIELPLSSRQNIGSDISEAARGSTGDSQDKPTLRYLIHLHICCPSKGRHFLYKSVRVVFANRVPDGKEKLCNELQLPEPRFSAYKPGRDSLSGVHVSVEDRTRRCSGLEPAQTAFESQRPLDAQKFVQSLPRGEYSGKARHDMPNAVPTMPRQFDAPPVLESRPAETFDNDTGSQSTASIRPPLLSPASDRYAPKNSSMLEDPFNFRRDRSRERRSGYPNESLLSKRLMDLAFQAQAHHRDDA